METNKETKQNTLKGITLVFQSNYLNLQAAYVPILQSDCITLSTILHNAYDNYLLKLHNDCKSTFINLTQIAPPLALLFFDDHLYFAGATMYSSKSKGSYIISTAFKNVLVLKNYTHSDFSTLLQLQLNTRLREGKRSKTSLKYVYSPRPHDNKTILSYKKTFKKDTLRQLVAVYNQTVAAGICGVHQQALMLIALREEFLDRINESPIRIEDDTIISLTGNVELINGCLKARHHEF